MILWNLIWAFLRIGLFSVGGGYAAIPLIQDQIVTLYNLLTMEEFTDLVTVAEMTPGPILINAATFVGMQVAGLPGVVLCSVACVIPSFCISLILAHFYYKYRSMSGVQTVLAAMRPAVVALIGSAAMSILLLAVFQSDLIAVSVENIHWVELGVFGVALLALRRYKVSPVAVILGSGVVGTIIYCIL